MRKFLIVGFIVIIVSTQLWHKSQAAAGKLDLAFGAGGKVTTNFVGSRDSAAALALQPDGKIIAVGYAGITGESRNFALVRYNTNGSLDSTFGNGGKVSTDFGGHEDLANAVALQSDGKIVVAGSSRTFPSSTAEDFGVARYNSDGSLDTSFNGTGKLTLDFGTLNDEAAALAVQPDGKIVVAGHAASGGGSWDFALVRFNPTGSLDTTFDNDGIVTTDVNDGEVRDILLQQNEKIIAIGHVNTSNGRDFMLARYDPNGGLDTTFDTDGLVTTDFSVQDYAEDGTLQADGKIVVAGKSISDFALARYNIDGSPDTSFDGDGKLTTNFNGAFTDYAEAVVVQPNGKIIAAGSTVVFPTQNDFAVARYNSDGSLDNYFDGDGKLTTAFGNMTDWASALVIQPDGKILAAGTKVISDSDFDFALVRYLAVSPQVSSDFDGDKKSDIALYRPSNGAWYLLQSTAGFTGVQFGISTDKIVPADYDGDNKTDVAVYRDGAWYLLRSTLGFTGVAFGVASDIPQPADFDGDGKAELAVFRPSDGTWYVLNLVNNQFTAFQFGISTDKPVVGDYDGDGKADYAVYRDGSWYLLRSQLGFTGVAFGEATDRPVVGDYDGDGKSDIALYRPSNGTWYSLQSTAGFTAFQFGLSTDVPSPGDYDGDGKTDIAVFRPSDGVWYELQSTAGFYAIQFGSNGDVSVPSAYVP